MATVPQAPPAVPAFVEVEDHHQQHYSSSPDEVLEEADMMSKVPIRSSQPVMQVTDSQKSKPDRSNPTTKDPEVEKKKDDRPAEENVNSEAEDDDPHDPLKEFDWNDFESRYEKAMQDANDHEESLRSDFERLTEYFGVWSLSASDCDHERSSKRIKTRALYVRHAEETLEQKKQHYNQVVQAFKSALALLSD